MPPGPDTGVPAPRLFREEALEHYVRGDRGDGLVRVAPPWTWAIVAGTTAILVAAIAASLVARVEVTVRARGMLRPATGVRVLLARAGGTVTDVSKTSGQGVSAGEALVRTELPAVEGQLLETDRQLERLREQFSVTARREDALHAKQRAYLGDRVATLHRQLSSLRDSERFRARKLDLNRDLARKGLESAEAVADAEEVVAEAARQARAIELLLDEARQELAMLDGQRESELWRRVETEQNLTAKRDALQLALRQATVVAPVAGTVEAMLVKPGDVLQAGQPVGKLIPGGVPLRVVSFLSERDRASVRLGDAARLELDQLPYGQHGTLRARVVRIADDLASDFEVREAFGESYRIDVPTYRVELDVTDTGPADAAGVHLRSGMLLYARFTARRERLAVVVLEPLRRWLR